MTHIDANWRKWRKLTQIDATVQSIRSQNDNFAVDFNKPAINCYESLGFMLEGIKRDARKFGDKYWHRCIMSIIEDEWHARASQTG